MMKGRDKSLDIALGFCLLVVMFEHLIGFCSMTNLYIIVDIFCFYLAFFFFKAGVCFHTKRLREIVREGIRRLILPYIIFSIVSVLCVIVWQTLTFEWMDIITSTKINIKNAILDTIRYGAPQANLPLWFLPSLFMCRILMNIMVTRFNTKVLCGMVVLIVAILQAIDCIESFNDIPLYVKNIPLGLSIMLVGYLAGKDIKQKFFLTSMATYILILIIYPSHLSVFGGTPKSGLLVTGYAALVTGCISIKGVASFITNCRTISFVLGYLGKHSMPYYCFHWILQLGICYLSMENGTQPWLRPVCMAIACLFLLPIFDKIVKTGNLRWVIGENK